MKIYLFERWRKIIFRGNHTNYSVSNIGRVRNDKKDKYMTPYTDKKGYVSVSLQVNKKGYGIKVHRLVITSFYRVYIRAVDQDQINHKDGDKGNNRLENLEWSTPLKNIRHAIDMGLRKSRFGEDSPSNKYSTVSIIRVCELISRGYTNMEICEMTDIPRYTIVAIRIRKIWKHISCNYSFPTLLFKHSKKYSTTLRDSIIKLLKKDFTIKQIIIELNLENSISIQDMIRNVRKTIGKGSTTIENTFNKNGSE